MNVSAYMDTVETNLKVCETTCFIADSSNFHRGKRGHTEKWAARITVAADGSSDFTDMNLFLPATEFSGPTGAHSRPSRDYHPSNLQ
jgi:hypothetical protein